MASQSPDANGIPSGQQKPTSTWGKFNNIAFMVQQALGKMQTATLVRVEACTNSGGLSPVGFVDVTPLVNQLDGQGNPTPHVTIYNVPYVRLQGGANAVIIDPVKGDIGLCAFASRDITKVKSTKKQSNPGSFRQYSFSDAMYMGGALNATPSQYIQFSAAGIKIFSPTQINVVAPDVQVNATSAEVNAATVAVTATTSASVTSPIINLGATGQTLRAFVNDLFVAFFNGHTHRVTAVGADTNNPTQTMSATQLTSTVKGG